MKEMDDRVKRGASHVKMDFQEKWGETDRQREWGKGTISWDNGWEKHQNWWKMPINPKEDKEKCTFNYWS